MADQLSFLSTPYRGHGDDIIVIGAGLAGLYCALKLAPHPVVILTPSSLGQGASSAWAQAGLASALAKDDSVEYHLSDTINAGVGLVDEAIARVMVNASDECVEDMLELGVEFNRNAKGDLILAREAAHGKGRIVGVKGDGAGRAIMEALIENVQQTPRIRVVEFCLGEELIVKDKRVVGVVAQDKSGEGKNKIYIPARAVVLACGGLGHLYDVTTNPKEAQGIGVGMALKAGAIVADMEFVQFHPTALDVGGDPVPLASEALRGHGALLVNSDGKQFMASLHKDADLAPRDVVVRGVGAELAASRGVFLDCRKYPGKKFETEFPAVYESCRVSGLDPQKDLLPVIPAAHYAMGGVVVDAVGRSSVDGLWACGEVACTGAHGANRLASNSLLEAAVFAARIAMDLSRLMPQPAHLDLPTPSKINDGKVKKPKPLKELWQILRRTMSENFAVVRTKEGMLSGLKSILDLERENRNMGFANSLMAAKLIAVSALERTESRGAHYRTDYPKESEEIQRNFLTLQKANEKAEEFLNVGSNKKSKRQ